MCGALTALKPCLLCQMPLNMEEKMNYMCVFVEHETVKYNFIQSVTKISNQLRKK